MTLLRILFNWILCGASFVAGYYMGKERELKDVRANIKKVVTKITNNSPVGPVFRPTQEQIDKRTNPYLKRVEEGKKAMEEQLKHIVVLNGSERDV